MGQHRQSFLTNPQERYAQIRLSGSSRPSAFMAFDPRALSVELQIGAQRLQYAFLAHWATGFGDIAREESCQATGLPAACQSHVYVLLATRHQAYCCCRKLTGMSRRQLFCLILAKGLTVTAQNSYYQARAFLPGGDQHHTVNC